MLCEDRLEEKFLLWRFIARTMRNARNIHDTYVATRANVDLLEVAC
jgi:hypothetical protein